MQQQQQLQKTASQQQDTRVATAVEHVSPGSFDLCLGYTFGLIERDNKPPNLHEPMWAHEQLTGLGLLQGIMRQSPNPELHGRPFQLLLAVRGARCESWTFAGARPRKCPQNPA